MAWKRAPGALSHAGHGVRRVRDTFFLGLFTRYAQPTLAHTWISSLDSPDGLYPRNFR